MQLTSMYFREYSKYGSEDYSTATQVEVPSTGNPNSAKRGRYSNGNTNASFNNISTNNRGGGVGPPPPGQSSQPVFDENLHCATCNSIGHAKWTCPADNCE
ncbi:hypothetical protein WJX77_003756 [Trebouxia sp. C0004]